MLCHAALCYVVIRYVVQLNVEKVHDRCCVAYFSVEVTKTQTCLRAVLGVHDTLAEVTGRTRVTIHLRHLGGARERSAGGLSFRVLAVWEG